MRRRNAPDEQPGVPVSTPDEAEPTVSLEADAKETFRFSIGDVTMGTADPDKVPEEWRASTVWSREVEG